MKKNYNLKIPEYIQKFLHENNIHQLYPTQVQAIQNGLLDNKNLVVSAPTASGKTLIAILASFKHFYEKQGKTLYFTPLRALATEKYMEFKKFLEKRGAKVALTTGDYDSEDNWLEKYDIIITTNEKADSLLRHKPRWLNDVSLLVVDEIHLINSPKRGPTLEITLAKFLALKRLQIIGLSATIRNVNELANWLNAVPIVVKWRPVELKEGVYYDGNIYFKDGEIISVPQRANSIVDLTLDCIENRGQVLIFTMTRLQAVSYARKLSRYIKRLLSAKDKQSLRKIAKTILQYENNRLTSLLSEFILNGVSFHHAGLSHQIRKIIEEGFRKQKIKVITATPTLAAGVNLPARRVIISNYRRYNIELGVFEKIPTMEYKQMAGRAGRPQYDSYGEAILIARTIDELEFLTEEYLKSPPEAIYSRLSSEKALRTHILALIASGYANNIKQLIKILNYTLFVR
ncbi:MAG: hypothetical protein DRO67_10450, partial [Candidatus Asgardarchaeum californiense]